MTITTILEKLITPEGEIIAAGEYYAVGTSGIADCVRHIRRQNKEIGMVERKHYIIEIVES